MTPNTKPRPFNGSIPKPVTFPKEKKGLKKYKKVTGELALFKIIASERKHVCVKCRDKIENIDHNNFDHIKPKSTHPELRLDKSNIQILCFDCHYSKHNRVSPLTPQ